MSTYRGAYCRQGLHDEDRMREPRPSKGTYLYKRRARFRGRKLVAQAVWIIKDSGRHIATDALQARLKQSRLQRQSKRTTSPESINRNAVGKTLRTSTALTCCRSI